MVCAAASHPGGSPRADDQGRTAAGSSLRSSSSSTCFAILSCNATHCTGWVGRARQQAGGSLQIGQSREHRHPRTGLVHKNTGRTTSLQPKAVHLLGKWAGSHSCLPCVHLTDKSCGNRGTDICITNAPADTAHNRGERRCAAEPAGQPGQAGPGPALPALAASSANHCCSTASTTADTAAS